VGGSLGSELGCLVLMARFVSYESGGTFVSYACWLVLSPWRMLTYNISR
jgi:hypothetical protein